MKKYKPNRQVAKIIRTFNDECHDVLFVEKSGKYTVITFQYSKCRDGKASLIIGREPKTAIIILKNSDDFLSFALAMVLEACGFEFCRLAAATSLNNELGYLTPRIQIGVE